MDFLELAEKRFSVRSFKPDAVPDKVIEKILEAGRVAPTACNKQPQKIIVVKSADGLVRFRKCTECHFNAPLAMIVCCDKTACWTRSYDGKSSADVDASIVTTHLMLEAADLGVGSTWVMYFNPEAVRVEFDLPDALEPIALLPMGYPADGCKPAKLHDMNKPLSETVVYA